MENQDEEYIIYKISTKNWHKVYRSSYNGKDFYKLLINQKNYDGTTVNYYKSVSFKKSLTPPQNGSIIRVKKAIENLYTNNIDKYNPISTLLVLDYELKEDEEQKKENAYDEFSQTLAENEETKEKIVIDDSQLPFL